MTKPKPKTAPPVRNVRFSFERRSRNAYLMFFRQHPDGRSISLRQLQDNSGELVFTIPDPKAPTGYRVASLRLSVEGLFGLAALLRDAGIYLNGLETYAVATPPAKKSKKPPRKSV